MAQTFDQYLAETGQQSTLDALRGGGNYQGAKQQYESQGWYGVNPAQKAAQDAADQSRKLTEQSISTLQAQQPKIGEIYGGKKTYLQSQVDPTKARYDALLADITRQQQTSEEQQTLATNQEYAKRGISSTSGAFQQGLQNTLNPIRRNYAGLTQQTGLEQEASLKVIQDAIGLIPGEEAQANISLAQSISNAQMGGAGMAQQNWQTYLANQQAQESAKAALLSAQTEADAKAAQIALDQLKLEAQMPLWQAQANRYNQLGANPETSLNLNVYGGGLADLWGQS